MNTTEQHHDSQLVPHVPHLPARDLAGAHFARPAPRRAEAKGAGLATVLRAFTQWWRVVVPAGFVLAIAGVAVVLASFTPKYTATAYVIIGQANPVVPLEHEGKSDSAFVETQKQLMISPVILRPALSRPGMNKVEELQNQEDQIAWVQKNLVVSAAGKSELYRVEFTSHDAEDAAFIVNSVIDAYLEYYAKRDTEVPRYTIELLQTAKVQRLAEVERLRQRMVELAKELGGSDPFLPNAQSDATVSPLAALRERLAEKDVEYEVNRAQSTALSQEIASPPQALAEMIELQLDGLPEVVAARAQITKMEEDLAIIKTRARGGENSQAYLDGRKKIAEAEAKLAAGRKKLRENKITEHSSLARLQNHEQLKALEHQKLAIESERATLRSRIDEESAKLRAKGGDSAQLEFVRTELAREEKVVDLIGSRKLLLEANLKAPPRIQPQQRAEVPVRPIEAWPLKFVGGAALVGLFAPFGLAVLWEQLVRRIHDATQLGHESSLDVVGEIAQLPSRPALLRGATGQRRLLREVGAYQESVDSLRTSLLLSEATKGMRVIAVASAASGEGKTSLASQLAASIARATGARVLAIDGDMRAPDLHKVFRQPMKPGLVEVLRGQVALDDATIATSVAELSLLPAGELSATPHQLVANEGFARVVEMARQRYEYVIIDTPPVLSASESMVMAKAADGVLLTALSETSRSAQVAAASERLSRSGATVLGAVLTGTATRRYVTHYGSYGYESAYVSASLPGGGAANGASRSQRAPHPR